MVYCDTWVIYGTSPRGDARATRLEFEGGIHSFVNTPAAATTETFVKLFTFLNATRYLLFGFIK
jgi:hypothetical protein